MKFVPDIAWRTTGPSGSALDPRLLPLLREIRSRSTLRAATAAAGMSYRNAWDLLGAHARRLGAPLVALARGRGASLTPLAERLLAADDAARAELDGLRFAVPIEPGAKSSYTRLRIVASHDLLLADLAADARSGLELTFRGSLESLTAYAHGEADLAGFHVQGSKPGKAPAAYGKLLSPRRDRIIRFAAREQGLIIARGNPKHIRTAADLKRRGVHFVNRQRGSGTRLLIDQLLRDARIQPSQVDGYLEEEFTHVAVAANVAAGHADAGVGVRAAAARFGLEFIPLRGERYWLAVREKQLTEPRVQRLLASLRGETLARLAKRLTGYDTSGAGDVCALDTMLEEEE